MADCDMNFEKLSELLDGELPKRERAALIAHIDSCPECRRIYDAFVGISDAMPDELSAPPAELVESIMKKLDSQGTERERVKRKNHAVRYLAVAACFVLVCAGAWRTGVFDYFGSGGDGAPASVARSADAAPEAANYGAYNYEMDLELNLGETEAQDNESLAGGMADSAQEAENGSVTQFSVQEELFDENYASNAAYVSSELERLSVAADVAVYRGGDMTSLVAGGLDDAARAKLLSLISGVTLLEYSPDREKSMEPYCTLVFTGARAQGGQGTENLTVTAWIVDGGLIVKIGGENPTLFLSDAFPIDFEEFLAGLGF